MSPGAGQGREPPPPAHRGVTIESRYNGPEMLLPVTLFVLFALLSTAGAYLVVAHHRGRGVATAAAAATLAFFVLLFWWISVLIQEAGLP